MTFIGSIFGFYAGFRRTAPSLMAAQLFGVCLLALCGVAAGFMILCQTIDAQNIAGKQFNSVHRTVPSLTEGQLIGVCSFALCGVAVGFMILCQIIDARNIAGK